MAVGLTIVLLSLAGLIAFSLGEVVHRAGGPAAWVLTLASLIGGMEGLLSSDVVRRIQGGRRRARFHLGEAVLLFLVAKVLVIAFIPGPGLVQGMRMWLGDPGSLMDVPTLAVMVFVGAGWWAMHESAVDVHRLGELLPERAGLSAQETLARRVLWGAVVLGVAASLARVSFEDLWVGERAVLMGPVGRGIAYLALGLVGIALAQREGAARSWRLRGVPVDEEVPTRWLAAAVVGSLVVAMLSLGVPLEVTAILSLSLAAVGGAVGRWILSALGSSEMAEPPPPPVDPASAPGGSLPQPDLILPDVALPSPDLPRLGLPAWIWSVYEVVFWVAVLVLVGYLLRSYVRARRERSRGPGRVLIAVLSALAEVFRTLWDWLRRSLTFPGRHQPVRPSPIDRPGLPSRRRRRFGRGGTAAERVIRLYMRMLSEGERRGLPRRVSSTPSEYQSLLVEALPSGVAEVEELTLAFLEARYSRHDIDRADVETARRAWAGVRAGLRARR